MAKKKKENKRLLMLLFYRSQIRPWLSYSIVQFGKILCFDSTHPPLLTPQEFAVLEGNEAYVTVCECLKTVRGNFVKSLKGWKAEGGGGRKERINCDIQPRREVSFSLYM